MAHIVLVVFPIFALLVALTRAFPFGAGLPACKTLIPGHKGVTPQSPDTLPFLIEPESDYFTPGRIFKVRIKAAAGKYKNRKIGGFLLQARQPDHDVPVGRWEVEHGESAKYGMKYMNCTRLYDSITHMDSKPKNVDMVLHFMPTHDLPDEIYFTGTIARDFRTFWAHVKSPVIRKRLGVAPEPEPEVDEMSRTTTTTASTESTTTPTTTAPRRIVHVTHDVVAEHTRHHPHISSKKPVHHHKKTTTMRPVVEEKFVPDEKYADKEAKLAYEKNELENLKKSKSNGDEEKEQNDDSKLSPDVSSSKKRTSNAVSSVRTCALLMHFAIILASLLVSQV